jgi:hypothetical protein
MGWQADDIGTTIIVGLEHWHRGATNAPGHAYRKLPAMRSATLETAYGL